MKMFPLKLLFFAASCFLALSIPAASGASSGGGTLREFFAAHGFGGAPLQRRFGNHLFVNTVINGRNTALMVDTGCPFTLIDRTSARRIGLQLAETKSEVTGITGNTQPSSVSRIATLAMGNCTFQNVPAEVAAEQDINRYARPHLDGLFGAHEMAKFGMIIDCGRQMLYVNPRGPSAATSQALATFLQGRGFVRVPTHFTPEHHLEVEAAVNLRARHRAVGRTPRWEFHCEQRGGRCRKHVPYVRRRVTRPRISLLQFRGHRHGWDGFVSAARRLAQRSARKQNVDPTRRHIILPVA